MCWSYRHKKAVPTKDTSTDFYILLAFLLINVALLIAISISCYLTKYQAKQKHLLPSDDTIDILKKIASYKYIIKTENNNKLKEIGFKNHTINYLNDITKIEDFDFNDILADEES